MYDEANNELEKIGSTGFVNNVKIGKPIITQTNVSDHLPVTCDVEF